VVAGVATPVESDRSARTGSEAVQVRMLGQMTISRQDVSLAVPAPRKVRALLAYLALAPRAVPRNHLCELLWDIPNDPKGELRWCLSKLRGVLDEPGRRRVETSGDTIRLDLADCFVDVIEISRATQKGIQTLAPAELRRLSELFVGEFLDNLEIERCPNFNGWVIAQRRRFRGCHAALLEHLVRGLPDEADELLSCLEKWLELAPFDLRAHEVLFGSLARRGRTRDGEEHLAAATRLFEAEGLDSVPLRNAWHLAKGRRASTSVSAIGTPTPHQPPLGMCAAEITMHAPRRASVAVMPFAEGAATAGKGGGLGRGLADDIITRLAKLRSLFVIAQGTVFALNERNIDPQEAGRTLNVDYVVSASLMRQGNRLTAKVELAETRTARIIWMEVYVEKVDNAFVVLQEIGNRIVASIVGEIETAERNRAILKPPNSLNAWEAYHRGLWHLHQYNRVDVERAQHFLEMAVRLDPTFARAYAGLSFAHFQNAFQRWREREQEIDRALEAAGQSLIVDDRDPAAHWAMGRAHWLRGRQEHSLLELETAVELSPSFAHGHYTLAFVRAQSGDARAAVGSCDQSLHLSPFDPLLFAMFATRAMALIRLGQFEKAADWAVKAAARPNAFPQIHAIAAYCLALAGRLEEAHAARASMHRKLPHFCVDDLLSMFRFSPDAVALFRQGAERIEIA
jgi:DNA-binding SARP family transcriptional activator/tetratricopeptide (TPR) repeat protein